MNSHKHNSIRQTANCSDRFFIRLIPRLFVQTLLLALIFGAGPTVADARTPPQDSPVMSLFDGRTLQNWDGDPRQWSVENGAITGTTTSDQPLDANSFLIWQGGEIGDFELSAKFRIESGNSGIQYRSQDLGEHHVGGYQADIDANHEYTGIFYEERGRGILAQRATRVEIDEQGHSTVLGTTCDEAALLDSIKRQDWSEYRITARGNHLTQSINGFITVDVVDRQKDAAKPRGILALQLHAGPPMKVQFKDIFLRRLNEPGNTPIASSATPKSCCQPSDCNCECSPAPCSCRTPCRSTRMLFRGRCR